MFLTHLKLPTQILLYPVYVELAVLYRLAHKWENRTDSEKEIYQGNKAEEKPMRPRKTTRKATSKSKELNMHKESDKTRQRHKQQ